MSLRQRLSEWWMRYRMGMNHHLITTTYDKGKTIVLRDSRKLRKVTGLTDNENEHVTWVEYWDGDLLVHRSAHVTLKRMPDFLQSQVGGFQ